MSVFEGVYTFNMESANKVQGSGNEGDEFMFSWWIFVAIPELPRAAQSLSFVLKRFWGLCIFWRMQANNSLTVVNDMNDALGAFAYLFLWPQISILVFKYNL